MKPPVSCFYGWAGRSSFSLCPNPGQRCKIVARSASNGGPFMPVLRHWLHRLAVTVPDRCRHSRHSRRSSRWLSLVSIRCAIACASARLKPQSANKVRRAIKVPVLAGIVALLAGQGNWAATDSGRLIIFSGLVCFCGVPGVPGVPQIVKPLYSLALRGFWSTGTPILHPVFQGVPGVPHIDAGTPGTPGTITVFRVSISSKPLYSLALLGGGTPGTPGTPIF